MAFLLTGIPSTSAAELLHMDYSSCTEEGGGGNAASVGMCGVGVCAREERGTLFDEAFLWQRCHIGQGVYLVAL